MDHDAHRRAETLDLRRVEEYLHSHGYSNISLEQRWRHVTGRVSKHGVSFFFKLASSPGVASKTRNEFIWNQVVGKHLASSPIAIPKSYECGTYNDLFWFTSEYIDGRPIVEANARSDAPKLRGYFDDIVETLSQILKVDETMMLPNDEAKPQNRHEATFQFLDETRHWIEQSGVENDQLFRFIQENMQYAQIAPSHGDFTPWHVLETDDGKLFLIDGEHGKLRGSKFFDVAYFYHRVFTGLERPDVAEEFLAAFDNQYKMTKNDKKCFRLILAKRVIGGYFDAKNNNQETQMHDLLRAKVLNNDLFTT